MNVLLKKIESLLSTNKEKKIFEIIMECFEDNKIINFGYFLHKLYITTNNYDIKNCIVRITNKEYL